MKKWRDITGISTPQLFRILHLLAEKKKISFKVRQRSNNNTGKKQEIYRNFTGDLREIYGKNTGNLRKIYGEFTEDLQQKYCKKTGKYLEIKIPKILEIADEYSKKRVRAKEEQEPNIQTKSVKNPENISTDKIRLDKIRVYKKDINLVFDYWKSILKHPKAKPTKDREAKIRARLTEGYSVDDLKKTIDGCAASVYHMGENDQNKIYDSIELLFRNGDKVEQFWGYLNNKKKNQPGGKELEKIEKYEKAAITNEEGKKRLKEITQKLKDKMGVNKQRSPL